MRVLKISGTDAYKFLQNLVSNDVGKVVEGKAVHSYLLTPQGKYLFDFFITKKDDAFYLIVLPTEKFSELLKKLKMYKLRSDVVIEDLSDKFSVLSSQLSANNKVLPPACGGKLEGGCLLSFIDPRAEDFCYHVIKYEHPPLNLPPQAGGETITPEEYKKLRIEKLIPEGDDFEYEGTYILQYRAVETNSVDFKKGCYVGQEVTARMHHKTGLRKTLYKVNATENLESLSGKEILDADELVAGKLLSASGNTALAFLNVDAANANSALKVGGIEIVVENK